MQYFRNLRPEVMEFVPDKPSAVLEIGCGSGGFRGNFPQEVEYWGVETHRQSAIRASQTMTRVLNGDFFAVSDQLPDAYFDVIVCNDVIEHIADTPRLMHCLRAKLKPGGALVGSIPNVRYAENLYNLLLKRDWTYTDSGILDRTHVRFYTRKSMRSLFADHGFEIERLDGINEGLTWNVRIKPIQRRIFEKLMGSDSRYLQFGFRARMKPKPSARGHGQQLYEASFRSFEEYQHELAGAQAVAQSRMSLVEALEQDIDVADTTTQRVYNGFCAVCDRHQHLLFDRRYSGDGRINWRERLVCVGCSLNNRMRLAFDLMAHEMVSRPGARCYLTEQVTAFAGAFEAKFPDTTGSEYLSPDCESGFVNEHLIRHEDLTDLSFEAEQFGVIGCFDVLEHVPDYRSALKEMRRVLAPDGVVVLTVPFRRDLAETLVRARLSDDGTVEHLLPPDYHGDPVGGGQGILALYHFGWDLLKTCREAGFSDVVMKSYWSSDLGYIGEDQLVLFLHA